MAIEDLKVDTVLIDETSNFSFLSNGIPIEGILGNSVI